MEESINTILTKEICDELGIKVKKLSYDWILELSKDDKIRHIAGNRLDINPRASTAIASDKYATYEVLKSQNVPVIEHTMIFNPISRGELIQNDGIWPIVNSKFIEYGDVVIKPNYGYQGKGVYHCCSMKEVENAIHNLFKVENSISICPYYDIKTEYRTFYLDGEIKLIYGKTKPFIVGDGRSTIGELIEKLDLPDNKITEDNIKEIDFSYVPQEGESIDISWKHNLSGGAKPTVLEKGELYRKIEQLAISAGKAMNIRYATIDIINTSDDNLYVLEVNSIVCASYFAKNVDGGREKFKEILRQAIIKMFE